MENDYSTRGLLVALGLIGLSSALPTLIETRFKDRLSLAILLFSLAFLGSAWFWPRVKVLIGQKLATSATGIATDFRYWLGLLILLIVIHLVSYSIAQIRNDRIANIIDNHMLPFKYSLERWVLPRSVSTSQRKLITSMLKEAKPGSVRLVVVDNDPEANGFLGGLATAIFDAQWHHVGTSRIPSVGPGLSLQEFLTKETAADLDKTGEKSPGKVLQFALREAGVSIDTFGSSTSADADMVVVSIGPRRRDASAPPQRDLIQHELNE
jgi:hypothetical protein